MTTADALNFFGSYAKLAKALGVSRAAPYQWGERPPLIRQIQIERLTFGNLKADLDLETGEARSA